ESELLRMVGVAGEQERDAAGLCGSQDVEGWIEARQRAVELDGSASSARRVEDRREVEVDGWTASDDSRRQMSDHAHAGVLHGGYDAAGLRRAIEVEVRVDGRDAKVEGRPKRSVVVELPGGADVELHTVQ